MHQAVQDGGGEHWSARAYTLRLSDIVGIETEHGFVTCDVLSPIDALAAEDSIDEVFHTVVGGDRGELDTPPGYQGSTRAFRRDGDWHFHLLAGDRTVRCPRQWC